MTNRGRRPRRVLGQAAGGMAIIAGLAGYGLGWLCWHWFTGAQFCAGSRRYVRREVRATGNWLVALVVLGVWVAPVVTVWVLASLVSTLVAAAVGWRVRQRLDRRVTVQVGQPVRAPRPAARELERAS